MHASLRGDRSWGSRRQCRSDWEIRVAMLLSLLLQMILVFVGPVRKRSSSPVPRFLVDLALGLMLNNIGGSSTNNAVVVGQHVSGLKRGGAASTSPVIFAFWTPFLLLHLGGLDTIIGLLFELFSACVIFFCSLKTNPMVPATVLMFFVGVVKYGERTYSLYSGSVDFFRFLCSACLLSSLVIFFFHGKHGFRAVDIAITYSLLLGGLALDAAALLMLLCSHQAMVYLEEIPRMAWLAKAVRSLRDQWRLPRWSERTSQLNLISKPDPYETGDGFFRRNSKWIANRKCVRGMLDDIFFIRREPLCGGNQLLQFVFSSLKERAMYAKPEDMNTICGCRGQGVLKELSDTIMEALNLQVQGDEEAHLAPEEKKKLLEDSVAADRELDESLLLWHIATDLCLEALGAASEETMC